MFDFLISLWPLPPKFLNRIDSPIILIQKQNQNEKTKIKTEKKNARKTKTKLKHCHAMCELKKKTKTNTMTVLKLKKKKKRKTAKLSSVQAPYSWSKFLDVPLVDLLHLQHCSDL